MTVTLDGLHRPAIVANGHAEAMEVVFEVAPDR